jgi:hypothetical protein
MPTAHGPATGFHIGHSRPTGVTWSKSSSGTGGEITTGSANVDDGRPDTLMRCKWGTGTQTTASHFTLIAEWDDALVPGLVGLSNISLPTGTKIDVSFRRSSDTAGTYPYMPTMQNNGQRIVEGPRGEKACWILIDAGASAVVGCAIKISNNVNGSASITSGTVFEIGEAVIAVRDSIDIHPKWTNERVDPTTHSYSRSRTPYAQAEQGYREMKFRIATTRRNELLGMETLFAKLDRGQHAVWIPRAVDDVGAFSASELHRTARIGMALSLPSQDHEAGPWYSSRDITVIESPIPE